MVGNGKVEISCSEEDVCVAGGVAFPVADDSVVAVTVYDGCVVKVKNRCVVAESSDGYVDEVITSSIESFDEVTASP